jgi:hypothetical protein
MKTYPNNCTIETSVPWTSTGNYRDLRIWLIDNIDEKCYYIAGADFKNLSNRIVWFENRHDAVHFILRWSRE